jgi:hypothetical protein
MPGLSFVTLLAYDYKYAYSSIRSYYEIADEILLGIDADRLTWMRQPFAIDLREVESFVAEIDKSGKIRIIEGNFHSSDDPAQNELIERSFLSMRAKPSNWIVQLDADELPLNVAAFSRWLLANDPHTSNVFARWITVFKVFENQALIIDPPGEQAAVATMLRGQYLSGRLTAQPGVMSPLQLLHYSWGRSPQQVRQKLANWGHALDMDTRKFFDFWQSVNLENFHQVRDFHPLSGPTWRTLKLVDISAREPQPTPAAR